MFRNATLVHTITLSKQLWDGRTVCRGLLGWPICGFSPVELVTVKRGRKCLGMLQGTQNMHCRGSCETVELSAVVYWVGQFQDFLW